MNMCSINNDDFENIEAHPKTQSEKEKEINKKTKELIRYCEDEGIPIFIAYYLVRKGYRYRAVLPEEIENDNVKSQYGKFNEFLKVCLGFNREEYETSIHTEE